MSKSASLLHVVDSLPRNHVNRHLFWNTNYSHMKKPHHSHITAYHSKITIFPTVVGSVPGHLLRAVTWWKLRVGKKHVRTSSPPQVIEQYGDWICGLEMDHEFFPSQKKETVFMWGWYFFGSCWKLLKDSILAKCKLPVYPTNAQIFWCFKRPVRCLLPNLSFHGRVGAPATDRADHCLSVKRGPRPWWQKCIGVWPPTCSSCI